VFYKTIKSSGESIYKEKGSRFLGFTRSVNSEQEVKDFIANFRKSHPQSVHVCYAFRLGADMKHFRYSDDGEPSNTAGPPIFGQIQQAGLTNCLVAVVRYYGGVKLGVGGLIQAYRQAAKEAINSSEIIETEDHFLYEIHCDFSHLPQVMNWLKSQRIDIKSQNYTEKHEIIVQIPNSKLSLLNHLATLNVSYKSLAQ